MPRAASAAERCAALKQFVSLVDGVLARRARSGCAAVETLSISYTWDSYDLMKQLMTPSDSDDDGEFQLMMRVGAQIRGRLMQASVHAVQGWVRYAFQHGAKSLVLDMQLPPRRGDDDNQGGTRKKLIMVIRLDDLPSPAGLETMRLALAGARLQLSTTAMNFASLKDLSLERIEIASDGGARLLARLVSSPSCPHLQKLRLSWVRFPSSSQKMRLEADMLSELWIEGLDIMSLELRTPSLRVLRVDRCHYSVLSLSAPRVEQVSFLVSLFSRSGPARPPGLLRIDGDYLPCVLGLKLCLWSHRTRSYDGGEQNDSFVHLLKRCSSLTCLEITLGGPMYDHESEEHYVDLIKDKVPYLPHITSLTVNVSNVFERHEFGAGVANLLTRFTNLTHLSLHLPFFFSLQSSHRDEELDMQCDHPDHWRSHEISMVHLQEVELTGLTGVDCELWCMKAVLASAKRLGKVAISFHEICWPHEGSMDAFELMLLDGVWTSRREEHMITFLK